MLPKALDACLPRPDCISLSLLACAWTWCHPQDTGGSRACLWQSEERADWVYWVWRCALVQSPCTYIVLFYALRKGRKTSSTLGTSLRARPCIKAVVAGLAALRGEEGLMPRHLKCTPCTASNGKRKKGSPTNRAQEARLFLPLAAALAGSLLGGGACQESHCHPSFTIALRVLFAHHHQCHNVV